MKQHYSTFIIDDDPIFVLLFKKIIEKSERFNRVQNFPDGQYAMDELIKMNEQGNGMPDIIFLDLNMPNIDGWQFLDAIQKQSFINKLNIYIVSSSIDNHEIERAKQYKCVKNFISKPISLDFFEEYDLWN
ncbi:response regulator [Flavobacterium sp.]|uniref:response regulator n=1 Tax=Flavobacterium sp. TaxID=239 RepID=UPI002B4B66A6|nr:response regulator [Flavobacterium sp.]HLP64442.1 response regulator [Flavobacterium sp.]